MKVFYIKDNYSVFFFNYALHSDSFQDELSKQWVDEFEKSKADTDVVEDDYLNSIPDVTDVLQFSLSRLNSTLINYVLRWLNFI